MSEPMAAVDDCEHHYQSRILGGHPLHVSACYFCRQPDWTDLMEQAVELYQWGWQEGQAGKPARDTLSAYDKPQPDPGPDDLVGAWATAAARYGTDDALDELRRLLRGANYHRQRAEAALDSVQHLADLIAAGASWTRNHDELARRIRDAATIGGGQTAGQAKETQ